MTAPEIVVPIMSLQEKRLVPFNTDDGYFTASLRLIDYKALKEIDL